MYVQELFVPHMRPEGETEMEFHVFHTDNSVGSKKSSHIAERSRIQRSCLSLLLPSQLPRPQEGIGRETCTPRPTSHCAFCMTAMSTDLFHCASIPTWLETDMAHTSTHQLPATLLLNCHPVIKFCTLYCCFWFMGLPHTHTKIPMCVVLSRSTSYDNV